ncbi:recombination-associated protein RdgC [Vibrio owensii]|uniref:recombination-associated protein RdgC n=1 Tax=Vibrio harveyi group TaxID=717610 RepID=UPI003CC554CC
MWFKNLNVYKLINFNATEEEIAEKLAEKAFKPCDPHDEKSAGWISPIDDEMDGLVHTAKGRHIISLKTEEKKVPASVINEELKSRISKMRKENPDLGKISRQTKSNLKDEIRNEMLPDAFSKIGRTRAYIDTKLEILVIDNASRTKAELFIQMLKVTLDGDYKCLPLQTKHEVSEEMAGWLKDGEAPESLEVGQRCQLRDLGDLGTIKYAKHALDDAKLIGYLRDDKTVSELELTWDEGVRFLLTEDFMMKGIKFDAKIQDQSKEDNTENEIDEFDSEFNIMTDILALFIPHMTKVLGGEHVEEE